MILGVLTPKRGLQALQDLQICCLWVKVENSLSQFDTQHLEVFLVFLRAKTLRPDVYWKPIGNSTQSTLIFLIFFLFMHFCRSASEYNFQNTGKTLVEKLLSKNA